MYDRHLDLRVNVPCRNDIIQRNNPLEIKVSPLEIEIRDAYHIGLIFWAFCVTHTTCFGIKYKNMSKTQKITQDVASYP